MDNLLIVKFALISSIFVVICIVSLVAIVRLNGHMKKEELALIPDRKLRKRKNSNIYDMKSSRGKK